MSAPLLSVENLHVRYGAVEVLKGVTLEVPERGIVALIGANGAGKTTTLMAISGLAPVTEGKIHLEGEPIQDFSPEAVVAKGVTQVPEGRRIFPRMTVMENLQLPLSFPPSRPIRPRGNGDRVGDDIGGEDDVWDLFPVLRERRKQLAGTLSGGEQQMLALARGLMARPRLLLLDEPSLGLAPKRVTQLFEVIRRIHEQGMAILLVEQNAYQALQVAQTAYVLETGRVVLHGPASRLREDPAVKQAYLGG